MTTQHHVLIVDDNKMALSVATHVFKKAGYRVTVAENGLEGLTQAKNVNPDLIILDIMMPGMSGLEVCQRLRADPATSWIPIIILSAKHQLNDKLEGFEAGADDYVEKPASPKELLARANALLLRASRTRIPKNELVIVAGVKGGVGATTVAVNLAAVLASTSGHTVTLLELRAHRGTVAHNLGLSPSQDLSGLLALEANQIKPQDVTHRLIRHASGMGVLVAPQQFTDNLLTPVHVKVIIEILLKETEYLIVDLPLIADYASRAALEKADRILLVTEPEPVSLACAQADISLLRDWGLLNRTHLVLVTRGQSNTIIMPAEIEKAVGVGVAGVIPPAPEAFYLAASLGNPLVLSKPESLGAKALVKLTRQVAEATTNITR